MIPWEFTVELNKEAEIDCTTHRQSLTNKYHLLCTTQLFDVVLITTGIAARRTHAAQCATGRRKQVDTI